MTWLATFFTGLLTGALGLLVSGFITSLAVDWYRISSFEGGSGYFMVIMALLGGAAGGVIGLVAARAIAGSANPGFLKALAIAFGIVLVLGTSIGGVARLLADVSPTIEGETLFVLAELRWPAADTTDPPPIPASGSPVSAPARRAKSCGRARPARCSSIRPGATTAAGS